MLSDPNINNIAANGLATAATTAALISALRRKNILTDAEITAVYKEALILLEIDQSAVPELKHVSDAAINILKVQLGNPPEAE